MNKQPWTEIYDVVMPILKRDWPAAQVNLPFVFKNLPIRRLVVLSGADLEPLLPRDERIVFVNENELMEGLTLASVKKAMYARIYTDKRAGWYFQQFLKLGYARAARLVDQMEEKGVVGPFEGSKPRQLLITKEQWQEMKYRQGVPGGTPPESASGAAPGGAEEDMPPFDVGEALDRAEEDTL